MSNTRRQQRSEKGFSLATVLIMGLVASLLITGMFSVLMPSYSRIGMIRTQTEMRNAAEAGLDWAVAQYNLDGGASAGIDNPTYNSGPTPWMMVPTSVVNPAGNNSFVPLVQVQVSNVQPPPTSPIYQTAMAYGGPNPNQQVNGITQNYWRVVTVRAVPPTTQLSSINVQGQTIANQQASALVKNLQVILRPYLPAPFSFKAISAGSVTFAGSNFTTNAYNSNTSPNPASFGLGGDIDVNTTIDLGNSVINGSVTSRAQPGGNLTTSYVTAKSNAGVKGIVKSNGLIDAVLLPNISGQYIDSNGNTQTSSPAWYMSQNTPQFQMPVVPPHPAGSTLLNPITSSQTLGMGGQTTNYYINAGGSEINLSGQSSITVAGPTRIYLEGNTANTPSVVSFSGKAAINNASQIPSNFMLFYSGTGTLDLSGLGTFYGVVVAPNATIKLNGNAQVYGALVGNVVGLNGGGTSGAVHYDQALNSVNPFPPVPSYQAISWREF